MIASEEVQTDVVTDESDHPVWKPNSIVYHLPKQGQIVHIVSESGLTKFFFHDAQPPFTKRQQIQVEAESIEQICTMAPLDLRKDRDKTPNTFIAIQYHIACGQASLFKKGKRRSHSVFGRRASASSGVGGNSHYKTATPASLVWFELED